jgi:2-polyprenyl-3-methyl-5-hydroxy-6-metoxy-1,4-benzoquinol methylase
MNPLADYLEINRALWEQRTPYHVASAFYDQAGFLEGRSSLMPIEQTLLGDITGKTLLHLQCHFGQDTLSLARLGASVTGVDFSSSAIRIANETNEQLRLGARFICSDVYALEGKLTETFDIVFTSYGALGWLPDMQRWGQVVAAHLKPGGRAVIVEFHPMVFMLNDALTGIQYSYFNGEAIVGEVTGTYAEPEAPIAGREIGWNHPLSEVIQSLRTAGLHLESFDEFPYSPYNCFPNMVETSPGRYEIRGLEGKFPMIYSLAMRRPQAG